MACTVVRMAYSSLLAMGGDIVHPDAAFTSSAQKSVKMVRRHGVKQGERYDRNVCRAAYNARREVTWSTAAGGGGSPHLENMLVAQGAQRQTSCAILTGQWTNTILEEENALDELAAIGTATSTLDLTRARELTLRRSLSKTDLALQRRHEAQLRVAYQGVPGAYSEAAAGKAYPLCEPVSCQQFEAAFLAVEMHLADRAVLPIENSLLGSIHRNYDLLLRHRLHIVGEVHMAVHHCLMALPGVQLTDLKHVVSHRHVLAQCEVSLRKLGVSCGAVDKTCTAGAAQFIAAHGFRDIGAIASARAAKIYGLNILVDGIQDDSEIVNVTRFIMLGREPVVPRNDRPFKTSIVFALEDRPGELVKALAPFALRGINLTKIESRPQRSKPLRVVDDMYRETGSGRYFNYLFYTDYDASMADPRAQNALGHLQELAPFLRVLGSYPIDSSNPLTSVKT